MQLIASRKTTIMKLTKLLGQLSFTAQAVLPGRIQCRYLQQQQIQVVRKTNSYQTKIKLSQSHWQSWSGRRRIYFSERKITENRNTTVNNPNGYFQNRLEAVCQGTTTAETWWYQERTKHINVLQLIVVKLAILTFTKGKSAEIHLQIDNMTALSYLVYQVRRNRSQELLQVATKYGNIC